MISEDEAADALRYLSETDERAAELSTEVERCEYRCKLARAQVFLTTEGTVDTRKARAETSEAVQTAEGARIDAYLADKKLETKRKTKELIVRVFQTISANRRQGQLQ